MQEAKVSHSAVFVTLTYNTDSVHITRNGFMSLKKEDLQKYFKRLRKLHSQDNKPLKYYAVGEYGGKTMRPHYHIIMFNAEIEYIAQAWTLDGKELGSLHIGDVTEASVGYTMKYISKPSKVPRHKNDDRLPEFSLMSKGLGSSYVTPAMIAWHGADLYNRTFVNLKGGKKAAMPRYLKDRIYDDEQRGHIAEYGKMTAINKRSKEMEDDPNYYETKLEVREYQERQTRKTHSVQDKL